MSTQTPEQRPDLYDDYDCEQRKPLSPQYLEKVLPSHLRAALAKRKSPQGDKPIKSE